MRYANNSQYKNDRMIRKEAFVAPAVLDELKKIILDSEVRAAYIVLSALCQLVDICSFCQGWL